MSFQWTEAKLADLARLWRDPACSMAEIARLLGTSKNAVAGMGHRQHGARGIEPARTAPLGPRARPAPSLTQRVPELLGILRAYAEAGHAAPTNAMLAPRMECSAGQVAEIMGAARAMGAIRVTSVFNTRRIVAGDDSWRLEPGDPANSKGAAELDRAQARARRAVPAPEAAPAPTPAPEPPRRVILSRAKCCQWPIGDVGKPGFRFCDSPEVVPGKPYCAEHCRVAFTRNAAEAALPESVARTRLPRGMAA